MTKKGNRDYGRRFDRNTGKTVPLLTVELADQIAEDLRKSLLPVGFVAEKYGVTNNTFRQWLHTGRRWLESHNEGGEEMTAQAYLASVVDRASAHRQEERLLELWETTKEFSAPVRLQVLAWASPRSHGITAKRDLEREATKEDEAVLGASKATDGSGGISAFRNLTLDELMREAKEAER